MNVFDYFSQEEDQFDHQIQSDGVNNTISTDLDRKSNIHKTKNIKKKYEPIQDSGRVYKYEDDPVQYKKARKKIQNRQSATRVRGKKKDQLTTSKMEVQKLKGQNHQLQLKNMKLQTQNEQLKKQVQFMKSLLQSKQRDNKVKHQAMNDSVGQYLNLNEDHNSTDNSSHSFGSMEDQSRSSFEPPFFDQQQSLGFLMLPNTKVSSSQKNWTFITLFTIVICIFVIPQSGTTAVIANQVNIDQQILIPWYTTLMQHFKIISKYLIIVAYSAFLFSFIYKRYFKKKILKENKII